MTRSFVATHPRKTRSFVAAHLRKTRSFVAVLLRMTRHARTQKGKSSRGVKHGFAVLDSSFKENHGTVSS